MKPMTVAEWDEKAPLEIRLSSDETYDRIRAALEHRERLVEATRRVLIYEQGSPEEGKAINDLEALVSEGKDGER